MTKNKRPENNPIPLPKPKKSKGSVTLGWSIFIDDIWKKVESQPSVGPWTIASRQPTVSLQAKGLPYIAYEVHSETEGTEQSFQEIENSCQISSQEGNSCKFIKEEEKQGKHKNQDPFS